ncbi:MAG: tetratricopeptide repeat protein [Candidatus Methylacidiphilales bacterium]|nr:hypothetical protein [Candidatus Methylacidiphilales bacterium]
MLPPAHDQFAENELPEDPSSADRVWISRWDGPWYMRPSLRLALILAVLVSIKLLAEVALEASQRSAGFKTLTPISISLQDRLSQNMMISLLAGLRGVVADFCWRDATDAWMEEDWARLRTDLNLATTLQPNSDTFWGMGGWQMAYNIATSKRNDHKEPNKALRLANERKWIDEGQRMMERGLVINPNSVYIMVQLAQLKMEKNKDPIGCAEAYEKASLMPGAAEYLTRLPGYSLMHSGKDKEALVYWRRLWARFPRHDEPLYQWRRILRDIKRLEDKLSVPQYERLQVDETKVR